MGVKHWVCSQNIMRMGEFAKWPGTNPRLPWYVDLSGYRGNLAHADIIAAFKLGISWWSDAAMIEPFMVQTPGEALIRIDFARIDGPSGILAWSELADNTNQPKTQRYDSGDLWTLEWFLPAVISHEWGHMFGLEHASQNSGDLMAPFIDEDVPKPTARDIQRLLGLGYAKRTGPPPPPPPGLEPNIIRFKKQLAAGDYPDFVLGSKMQVGDYEMFPDGGLPPTNPD